MMTKNKRNRMSYKDRVEYMANDLGMTLLEVQSKLVCTKPSAWKYIKKGVKPKNVNKVFVYFTNKYDLDWLDIGGFNQGIKNPQTGKFVNDAKYM